MSTPVSSDFLVTNAVLAARFSKKIGNRLSIHGISFNEYLIMRYLAEHSERSISRIELADFMGLSASGVTRLVAPMEKTGILERQASSRDARQSLVLLTHTGRRVFTEAQDSFAQIAEELTRHADSDSLAQIIELYNTLL